MNSYLKANIFLTDFAGKEQFIAASNDVSLSIDDNGRQYLILKDCDTSHLDEGRVVHLIAFTQKGVQQITAAVSFIVEQIQVNLRVMEFGTIIDRRSNVKVSVSLDATLLGFYPTEDHSQLISYPKPFTITLQNISVGGMRFVSPQQLTVGQRYLFSFQVKRAHFEVPFQILRQDPPQKDEDPNIFVYGCRFDPLPPDIDAFLCSYIYQLQIEQRKKYQRTLDSDL